MKSKLSIPQIAFLGVASSILSACETFVDVVETVGDDFRATYCERDEQFFRQQIISVNQETEILRPDQSGSGPSTIDYGALCRTEGPCSLRAALYTAKSCGANESFLIVLQEDAEYKIAYRQPDRYQTRRENLFASKLPQIGNDVEIAGEGSTIRSIQGEFPDQELFAETGARLFHILKNAKLNIRDLTVADGNGKSSAEVSQGGAIFNSGVLRTRNVLFENNTAHKGGAIYNHRYSRPHLGSGQGYIVIGPGTKFMKNSGTFRRPLHAQNDAHRFQHPLGAAVYNEGVLYVYDAEFMENYNAVGTAIFNSQVGVAQVHNTKFQRNFEGTTIFNGHYAERVDFEESGYWRNHYNMKGKMSITASYIQLNNNRSESTAIRKGAIVVEGGHLDVRSSTISDNGLLGAKSSSIIQCGLPNDTIRIVDSTIAANLMPDLSTDGDFPVAIRARSECSVTLENSMIVRNGPQNCKADSDAEIVEGLTGSLSDDRSCNVSATYARSMELFATQPRNASNYQGHYITRLAVDAGRFFCLHADQRGVQRPISQRCDIGAIEWRVDNNNRYTVENY